MNQAFKTIKDKDGNKYYLTLTALITRGKYDWRYGPYVLLRRHLREVLWELRTGGVKGDILRNLSRRIWLYRKAAEVSHSIMVNTAGHLVIGRREFNKAETNRLLVWAEGR
jgi:hypothetical protein